MVEFISAKTRLDEEVSSDSDEPPDDDEDLEEIVEEETSEAPFFASGRSYLDEPVSVKSDYYQPPAAPIKNAPDLRDELVPMVSDSEDTPVVIDVFSRYGRKENKWWLDGVVVGVLK